MRYCIINIAKLRKLSPRRKMSMREATIDRWKRKGLLDGLMGNIKNFGIEYSADYSDYYEGKRFLIDK